MGNLVVILLRIGARVAIWLAPLLLIGFGRLFQRYRWPVYYRLMSYQPKGINASVLPRVVLLTVLGILAFAVLLFISVRLLAPVP